MPPKVVIADCLKSASQSALAALPNVNHLKRNVQNVCAKKCNNPKLPPEREDIVIPKKYKQTARGEDFVLFDSGMADDRILMFGTQKNLRVLQNYELWLVHGMFKTSPKLLYQLYTVHGVYESTTFPLVYALLPNKSSHTYTRFVALKTVLMDFERAVMNIFKLEFPFARQQGCFFHFCQAVMRRIADVGLKKKYEMDSNFALHMCHLKALAFVLVNNVVKVFDLLLDHNAIPTEAADVLEYFEDMWIGRPP